MKYSIFLLIILLNGCAVSSLKTPRESALQYCPVISQGKITILSAGATVADKEFDPVLLIAAVGTPGLHATAVVSQDPKRNFPLQESSAGFYEGRISLEEEDNLETLIVSILLEGEGITPEGKMIILHSPT